MTLPATPVVLFLFLFLSLKFAPSTFAQTTLWTGEGSATVDNSTVIVSAGTTELRFSESTYFGPNSHWEIHGTLEIWSKRIWIAPTARFTGTGKIIIHSPGENPYYEHMESGPTEIDGNNGQFIGVAIELRNPLNLVLKDISDPGYGISEPTVSNQTAALNVGSKFIFGVDNGDVVLNGNDFVLSAEASLEAAPGGALGAKRMIVTGNSIDGHVIKYFANTEPVTFPVGIQEGDYTPATLAPLESTSISVSVQDYVVSRERIPQAQRGMDRVWHIYADRGVNTTYTLQHNRITNGVAYVDSEAQIMQYAGGGNWIGDATVVLAEGIHTRQGVRPAVSRAADPGFVTKFAEMNRVLQANNDVAVGTSCDPITINVLNNDEPGTSAILVSSVRVVEQPRHGSVIVNLDGSLTYQANNKFLGQDSLRYEITDEEGFVARAQVNLMVNECGIKIPNTFTPNGDGVNDVFVIPGSERFERMELMVFNRWGNEVYRNFNYRNDWAGLTLNEGVYYFQLTAYEGGRRIYQEGWVLLKRN